eukprot:32796-Lingulodinium_polyedra.AAC.1
MGYLALEAAGLTEAEEAHVFGLTNFSLEFDQVARVLRDLYPRGSWKGQRGGAQHAHLAAPSEASWGSESWSPSQHH